MLEFANTIMLQCSESGVVSRVASGDQPHLLFSFGSAFLTTKCWVQVEF